MSAAVPPARLIGGLIAPLDPRPEADLLGSIPAGPFAPGWQLFTATIRVEHPGSEVLVFHACHASRRSEVVESLAERVATAYLAMAKIQVGIDADDHIVRRLVPSAILQVLVSDGDRCAMSRPLASGGVLHIVEASEL